MMEHLNSDPPRSGWCYRSKARYRLDRWVGCDINSINSSRLISSRLNTANGLILSSMDCVCLWLLRFPPRFDGTLPIVLVYPLKKLTRDEPWRASITNTMSLSKKYQKLSHVEHVLKKPDTYVGSCAPEDSEEWVAYHDSSSDQFRFEKKMVHIIPGLYKCFDELRVNALDQWRRTYDNKSVPKEH